MGDSPLDITFFPPINAGSHDDGDAEANSSDVDDTKKSHSPMQGTSITSDPQSSAEGDDTRYRTYSTSVVDTGFSRGAGASLVRAVRSSSFTGSRYSVPNQEQVQFHTAIAKRDYKRIKNMLVNLPRLVKCVDEFHRTPLHAAAELGDIVTIELLIQYNADVNALDARGRSCIHLCSDPGAVRLLCEEGAALATPDKNGQLPLHSFITDGNKECMKVLLEFGADPMVAEPLSGRNSVHLAADAGDFELLSNVILLSTVAIDVNAVDNEGNTPLHLVVLSTHPAAQQLRSVLLLLDKGARAGMCNRKGFTPLHFSCGNRFFALHSIAEPMAQVLLEMGADVNARDEDGCTALIVACAHREWGLCRLLFQAGGDMNIPCPMSSYLLQEGFGRDVTAAGMIELEDCTASDLMQRQLRPVLFAHICALQSEIPLLSRDRCMNCANVFPGSGGSGNNGSNNNERSNSTSSVTSTFSFVAAALTSSSSSATTGRVHCRLCQRVTCTECTNRTLPRASMPPFVTCAYSEREMKLCNVCFPILSEAAGV